MTNSGYAVAFKGVNTKIQTWQSRERMTSKVPTTVLFKPDKSFYKFGHEAVAYMQDNVNEENVENFYFFPDLKMLLCRTKVST
jgi:hypothetical protein